MALNVVLPNLSLAFSSVTFYQIARILLTPVVALLNFFLYGKRIPARAVVALVPACIGVGVVSYYDSLPPSPLGAAATAGVTTTTMLGVGFAFSGIAASSLYTVWIASYHDLLLMDSMQLLHNQAPVAAALLLLVIPFSDSLPRWEEVPARLWALVLLVCMPLSLMPSYNDNNFT